MFKPIVTNADPYRGPASGHSGGEHGDNWNDAVKKINDGFAAVEKVMKKGGPSGASIEEIEKVVGEIVAPVVEEVRALAERVAALETFFGDPATLPSETTAVISGVEGSGDTGNKPQAYDASVEGSVPPPKHEPGAS